MSSLISCKSISKSYGSKDLFRDLSITFSVGDRVGLIGPNGKGKSTFLKILAELDHPDEGEVTYAKDLRIGYVPQHVEKHAGTVFEVIEEAWVDKNLFEEGEKRAHLAKALGKVGLSNPDQLASELSGGWARRLSLAKALVNDPDILLLDEPTNHLDLETIMWLEAFLIRTFKTFIITSHDRTFLDQVCNRICELSHRYPQGIFTVNGTYSEFLSDKEDFLLGQKQYERSLRSKSVREEQWLKQSPKARSTKARARIQEAARLKHELAKVKFRNTQNKAQIGFSATESQTKKLITGKNLSKKYGDQVIFSKQEIQLMRGDRLAVVGGNGSGKSTFLKMIAQEIESDTGTLKYAEDLKVFYFDQHRESLDLKMSLRDALSPEGDLVSYRGKNIHINSWCEKFLFDKNTLDLPIKVLSGGERARILIARLMTKTVDVLLLDEPTNDLDIDTLEILEESLDDFPGSVVLVSHDRALIDRMADKLIAIDEDPEHCTFNDTEQWLKHQKKKNAEKSSKVEKVFKKPHQKKSLLSYKEKQELMGMDDTITRLGKELEKLSKILEDPKTQSDSQKLEKACQAIAKKQAEIDKAYERWQELEDKSQGEI